MIAFAVIYGPMGAYLPELYGTRLRYSGAAVGYNLGGVLGGALAPTIAARLLGWAEGSWAISAYILAMSALSFVCVLLLSELREEERGVLAAEGEPASGGAS